MNSFLKVSAGTAFLMTIVLVPVLAVSALLLFLLSDKGEEKAPSRDYITLVSYEKETPQLASPVGEAFVPCDKELSLCKEIKVLLDTSCSISAYPSIQASGYFKGEAVRGQVAYGCPNYAGLLQAMAKANSQ